MVASPTFIFGAEGLPKTPQEAARLRAIAQAMAPQGAPKNVGEGLTALGNAIAYRMMMNKAAKGEAMGQNAANNAFSALMGGLGGGETPASASVSNAAQAPSGIPMTDAAKEVAATSPATGDTFTPFMDTIKTSVQNPYALAAIAATGRAESGWSAKNANRTWSDPSESGQAGTAGGIMSWRGPRYQALASTGDLSPQGQAKFFLNEDPALIQKLNSAKSVEEAQQLMNNAWAFAGYNRPGGESARRLSYAKGYLPTFQGGAEVASLDPASGMASAPQAIEAAAPASGYVDPMVSAPNSRKPVAQALAQQPVQTAQNAQPANSRQGIVQALMGGQQQTQDLPENYYPAAPAAPGATSPSRQQIMRVLADQFSTPEQKAIAQDMYQQMQQANDPLRQLQLQKGQLELEQMRNPQPEYDIISGKDGSIFRTDKKKGTVEQVYGGKPDLPTDVREYEYAKNQGFQGSFVDFQLAQKKAGASQVNIDQKAEGAFDKKLAEKQAESLDTMATEGMNARADLGVIEELGTLMAGKGGTLDGISGTLAKYGIGGENVGDIQAAQALINRLVPTQRQPGSGSMSDRDVELFTRSLPSLWNQPGGNERILNTMRGLAQYKQSQGDIAQRVMTGEITRQDATKMLRELPNPLAGFKADTGADTPPEGVDAEDWKLLTPEERKLWQK